MSAANRGTTLFVSNIDWDFVWQRHQTLASLFAGDGPVVFCQIPGTRRPGFRDAGRILSALRASSRDNSERRDLPASLKLVRPFVFPATNAFACALNARLVDRWLSRQDEWRRGVEQVINYSQSRTALQLIERVPCRALVYDCTDDWLQVRGIPSFLASDERELLRRADLTLVPSRRLEELKRPHARRLERLPHGVLLDRFLMEPRRRATSDRITLLYYGHLHDQHLDVRLIEAIARLRPNWSIVLVGPVKTPFRFPSNVSLPGQLPHERLREPIAGADVLLLPYVLNEYTRSVLPAKVYECLATGRPIVATPLPELTAEFASLIRIASNAPDCVDAVESSLKEDPSASEARVAVARENSWEKRYRRIIELLRGRQVAA